MVKNDKKSALLFGIDAISEFSKQSIPTLISLRNKFEFPMIRNKDNIWIAQKSKIIKWFKDRKLTPETVNESSLEYYVLEQRRRNGIKTFNKKLCSLDEIAGAVGLSTPTVLGWIKNYDGCPVRKENGDFICDADDLYFWTKKAGLNCRYNFYNFGQICDEKVN